VIKFSVNGDPIQQGSMKVINGRVLHAKGAELIYWRSAIALKCAEIVARPLEGAVTVKLDFRLAQPRSVRRQFPTKYPDLDKLIRAVLDALTGVGYIDDSQVVNVTASKRYGAAGVDIEIDALEEIWEKNI